MKSRSNPQQIFSDINGKRDLVVLVYTMSRIKNEKTEEVRRFHEVPPLGLFFMSREKLGFCLIRRHGCLRNSESHDATSSPQSTVSTLEEEGGLGGGPKGNLQFDACSY